MSARLCLVTSGCSVLLCSLSPGRLSVAAHGFSRQNARVRPRPALAPPPALPTPLRTPLRVRSPGAHVASLGAVDVCVRVGGLFHSESAESDLGPGRPQAEGLGLAGGVCLAVAGSPPSSRAPPRGPRLGRASPSVLTETRPSLLQKSRTAIRRTHEHETAELRHNRNPLPTRVPEPRAAEKPRRGSKELRQPRP